MVTRKKSILIVGGTSGIGLFSAKKLSDQYKVFIAGRRKMEDATGIKSIQMDVLNENSIKACFLYLKSQIKELYAIVYSVGVTVPKASIEDFSLADWERVMNTNVTGAILCLKYAFPLLQAGKGKVVLINSVAGRSYSQLSGFQYTVSKSALTGLARQLAAEWAEHGIQVNSLYPSMTKTPMLEENVKKSVLKKIEKDIPLKRIAFQDEIASAIEFLVSPNNSYMTGCGLDINGGQFFN